MGSTGSKGERKKIVVADILAASTSTMDSPSSSSAAQIAKGWKWISNASTAGNGRVWLLWNSNMLDITYLSSSDHCLTCLIKSLDGRINCYISFIYAFNSIERRISLWDELTSFKNRVNIPWLLMGDFNAILSGNEILGGSSITGNDAEYFQRRVEVFLAIKIAMLINIIVLNKPIPTEHEQWFTYLDVIQLLI
ncbi:uncharacterized protein LOC109832488 [Asparagus officinalis]|uniref:uncharacterized protein LOC109832488 n=1 Tax=Asparagus officinalis TaxID=4686 RepID=UPI00098E6A75|nr:uncharacterized protein LOC109832488 [Asparagus officinalis]